MDKKEQSRQRQQRYRERQKSVTNSNATVTQNGSVTEGRNVIPDLNETIYPPDPQKPANFGQDNCQCKHCQNNRSHGSRLTINHGPYKPASELSEHEVNRVSLPSDVDYAGVEVIV